MSIHDQISRRIRPAVLAGRAYHVPDAAGLVKLDAMENPYSWPEEMKQAWLSALAQVDFNRYPDASGRAVKQALRRAFGIGADADVLLGNGSDEIIQIITAAVAAPGVTVLAPEPSFAMYRIVTEAAGARYCGVPLRTPDFALDVDAMLAAIEQHDPAVVFIAWPNNPTGNLFSVQDIDRILDAADGLVVVDEAYHAFAGSSFMPALDRHENLLVMRTLSKLGLAGLRFGFIAGAPAWLEQLDKLRLPYNVSVIAQVSVEFVLRHMHVLEAQAARIRADRDALYGHLKGLDGICVWPSAANFLLLRTLRRPATQVYEGLRARGLLVKNLHGSHPMLSECLRVTVGSAGENEQFVSALTDIIGRD